MSSPGRAPEGWCGLVTAMLAAPDADGRPLFATKDINDFYLKHCPSIFPTAR
jgi:hypothetical protein